MFCLKIPQNEIILEFNWYKIYIAVLKEIQWKGKGKINSKSITKIYWGEERQQQKEETFLKNEKDV